MSAKGPIVIIEDDEDDQFLLSNIMEELGTSNPLLFFENGQQALHYLQTTTDQPFLILCDVNMPVMNGLELRDHIEQSPVLKQKSIPFVFISTSGSRDVVQRAYRSTIQGFFRKESSFELYKQRVATILAYWNVCLHPNNQP